MSKRLFAVLLIVVGILAIAGVLYWTFRPTFEQRVSAPREESGSVLNVAPSPAVAPSTPVPPTPAPSPTPQASSVEEQEQQLLRQRASAFVARQGSYTNVDGFAGLRDVYLDVSPTVRAFYQAEGQRLAEEHPVVKGAWVQTTRALSSKILSETPIVGKNQVLVSVQAQEATEAGSTPATLSYRTFTLTFTREQGVWVITRTESAALQL